VSVYNACVDMELIRADGVVVDYISIHQAMVPLFRDIEYYKYIFKEGDRIDRVAKSLLGSTEHWKYIMLLNPQFRDPTELKKGDIIKIPVMEESA